MSESRFDRLAGVINRSSRRLALKSVLGGATLAAAGLIAPASESGAKKRKKRKKKCPTCPTPKVNECPTCQGLANGEACVKTTDCCGTETNLVCAKTKEMVFGTVCCGTTGAPCAKETDCCDGFICNQNIGTCFTI